MEGLRNIVFKGAFYYRKAVRQPGHSREVRQGHAERLARAPPARRLNWVGIVVMLGIDVYLFGFFVGPLPASLRAIGRFGWSSLPDSPMR